LLAKKRLYEGILQLLQRPPQRRAVLTNKPGRFARQILQGLGVGDAFRAVVGGDEAPRKPAPDGLLRICADLQASPREALLVGDSAVDLATGKAADVRVCAVTWGLGERAALTSADYLCDRPVEVGELLQRLAS
jgi:phosphoglycolate phosphatase